MAEYLPKPTYMTPRVTDIDVCTYMPPQFTDKMYVHAAAGH